MEDPNPDFKFHMEHIETYKQRCNAAIDCFTFAADTLEDISKNYNQRFFYAPLETADVLVELFTDIENGLFQEKPNFEELETKANNAKEIQKTQFQQMALAADFHLKKRNGFTKQALLDIYTSWQDILELNRSEVPRRDIDFNLGHPSHLPFIQIFDIPDIDIFGALDDDDDTEDDREENLETNLLFRSFLLSRPIDFANEPSISEISVDPPFEDEPFYVPIEQGEFHLFEAERRVMEWGIPIRRRRAHHG